MTYLSRENFDDSRRCELSFTYKLNILFGATSKTKTKTGIDARDIKVSKINFPSEGVIGGGKSAMISSLYFLSYVEILVEFHFPPPLTPAGKHFSQFLIYLFL